MDPTQAIAQIDKPERVKIQPEVLVRTALAIKLEAVRQKCTLAEVIDRLAEVLPQE